MKFSLLFVSIIFSIQIFGQDSLRIRAIDSTINENEKYVLRVVSEKFIPIGIYVSHGEPDTVFNIYKFSSGLKLVEYSKVWIGKKDTSQINSFFYSENSLIKVVTRIPSDSFLQFAYMDGERILRAMDSKGNLNPNTDYYFKRNKEVLKSAKRMSKFRHHKIFF